MVAGTTLKTVENLKEEVAALLTGINMDNVPNLYGSFERAVSTLIEKADVLEASARLPIMLYDGVTDYNATEWNIMGGALIDVRPQGIDRRSWDDVVKMPINRFDRTKWWKTPSGYRVTFETRVEKLICRISQNIAKQKVQIDPMSSTDGWTLAGDGSGLAKDETVFYHTPASLRFNLTASGSAATLTKTLSSALDLSAYEGVGVVFLALYLPSTTPITSISLKIGSSAADYIEITATEGFLGAWYANDFLLTAFNTAGATSQGTVDWEAIDYVQLTVNFNGTAVANMRVGDLFISLPSSNEVLYYSPAVFKSSSDGQQTSQIGSDEDEILFRNAAYNLYVQEAAREIAKNIGGQISNGVIAGIDLVLHGDGTPRHPGLYGRYVGDNPSQELRTIDNWYYDDTSFSGDQGGLPGSY